MPSQPPPEHISPEAATWGAASSSTPAQLSADSLTRVGHALHGRRLIVQNLHDDHQRRLQRPQLVRHGLRRQAGGWAGVGSRQAEAGWAGTQGDSAGERGSTARLAGTGQQGGAQTAPSACQVTPPPTSICRSSSTDMKLAAGASPSMPATRQRIMRISEAALLRRLLGMWAARLH